MTARGGVDVQVRLEHAADRVAVRWPGCTAWHYLTAASVLAAEEFEDADDPDEICTRCAAGVWSTEHHNKCVVIGYAVDGESAEDPIPAVEDWAGDADHG